MEDSERRKIFFAWEFSKKYIPNSYIYDYNSGALGTSLYNQYFPFSFNGMNKLSAISFWMKQFEIFLYLKDLYTDWNHDLVNSFRLTGKPLACLNKVIDCGQIEKICNTLRKNSNLLNNRFINPRMESKQFNLEDSLSYIQALLDTCSPENRQILQIKLQNVINQFNYRAKKEKQDKLPLNSYIPKKTMEDFEAFRKKRGISKEEAIDYLIREGLSKHL